MAGDTGSGGAGDEARVPLKAGCVLKVTMTNFMTYDFAELHPGAGLNLIIGKNGSGKSTVMCAMCLGLGGDPKLLGRANDLSGFVKNGKTEATIRIELQEKGTAPPTVVERVLMSTSKHKSTWRLNGKPSKKDDVREFLRDNYQTQVDNLCQFLPQDKVSMFGRLNQQELLAETMRAALGEDVVKEHQELATEEAALRDSATTAKHAADQLALREQELEGMREAVQRLVDREKLEGTLRDTQAKLLYVRFQAVYAQHKAQKAAADDCKGKVALTSEQLDGAKQALDECLAALQHAQRAAVSDVDKRAYVAADKAPADLGDRRARLVEKAESAVDQVRDACARRRAAEQGVAQYRTTAAELSAAVEAFRGKHPTEALRQDMQRAQQAHKQARDEGGDKRTRHDELRDRSNAHRENSVRLQREREGLARQMASERNAILNLKRGNLVAGAWDAVRQREQAREMRGQAFLPVLSVKPRDPETASLLERVCNSEKLATLVFTDPEDARQMKVPRIDTYVARGQPRNVSGLDAAALREAGISGCLTELVEAPAPVMHMLRDLCGLDKMLVGTRETAAFMERQNNERLGAAFGGYTVLTPNSTYSIRQSKHGDRNTIIDARHYPNFAPARYLGAASASEALQRRAAEVEELLRENEARGAAVDAELAALAPDIAALREREHAAAEDLERLRRTRSDGSRLEGKLQQAQEALARAEKELARARNVGAELRRGVQAFVDASEQLLASADKACVLLADGAQAQTTLVQVIMRTAHAKARHTAAEKRHRELAAQHDAAVRDHARLKQLAKDLRNESKTLRDAYVACDKDDDGLAAIKEEGQHELEAAIRLLEVRLRATPADPKLLDRFRALKVHVQEMRDAAAHEERDKRARLDAFAARREAWKARVQTLIDQIDANFRTAFQRVREQGFACEGAVHLDLLEGDLPRAGVRIMVRFRDGQELQKLDVHVQSGGERSLTTFMYLLSLNEVSRVPFRVVDEINQGMDEEKERIAMTHLFANACHANTGGQYFLITPKLLTGLPYNRNTTLHIVYNGAGALPQQQMDMPKFLKQPRKRPSVHPSPTAKRAKTSVGAAA